MNKLLYVGFVLLIVSCKKNIDGENKNELDTSKTSKEINIKSNAQKNEDVGVEYHQIETLFEGSFELIEKKERAIGNLNNDGLNDMSTIVSNDGQEHRVLVFLQNPKSKYQLSYQSGLAYPDWETENGPESFEEVNLSIEKGILNIFYSPYSITGNLEADFKIINDQFQLIKIATYQNSAGANQYFTYDLIKNTLEQEIENKMEENIPSEKKIIKTKPAKFLFEESNPVEIIENLINSAEGLMEY